jgi:peptidyl-prolyl cis-trans isomerase-like 4
MAKLNTAFTDIKGVPIQPIRIKHTNILFDPFEDTPLPGLESLIPARSPSPINDDVDDADLHVVAKLNPEELEEKRKERETRSRAVVLEMMGDIESADQKPPENVLFVCKLNRVTDEKGLKIIFSKYGRVLSCEVIRDRKTGDSLRYAFIEFETKEACEEAYMKMENALIDDRRIHVDFSQSVAKLWNKHRRSKLRGGRQSPTRYEDIEELKKQDKFEYRTDNRQRDGKSYDLVPDDDNDYEKRDKRQEKKRKKYSSDSDSDRERKKKRENKPSRDNDHDRRKNNEYNRKRDEDRRYDDREKRRDDKRESRRDEHDSRRDDRYDERSSYRRKY